MAAVKRPATRFAGKDSACRAALLVLALVAGGGCAAGGGSAPDANYVVTVNAGAYDRYAVPVEFDLPAGLRAGEYHLRAPDGRLYPLQIGPDGKAHFIVDSLAAGETVELALESGSEAAGGVLVRRDSGAVTLSVDGKTVLRYNAAVTDPPRPDIDPVYRRGGYVHPILTPEGVLVSGDYPPDHLHHHGIWAAWTRAVFQGQPVDFWNVADRKGDVLPVALDSAWGGQVFGGFSARHRYVALTREQPQDALNERWILRVYNVTGHERLYWLFDLEVEQRTAENEALVLPQYHYGGVAFRGRDDWYGAENASFVTSEGRDRESGNESRARWTDIGGTAEGGLRGVAVLSHPKNFRHPEPVRIHPREPYFVYAPSQLGEWSIEPGQTLRLRYRYVVHDGAPDAAELDRIWNDFAHPPTVTVAPR